MRARQAAAHAGLWRAHRVVPSDASCGASGMRRAGARQCGAGGARMRHAEAGSGSSAARQGGAAACRGRAAGRWHSCSGAAGRMRGRVARRAGRAVGQHGSDCCFLTWWLGRGVRGGVERRRSRAWWRRCDGPEAWRLGAQRGLWRRLVAPAANLFIIVFFICRDGSVGA